MKAYHIKRLRDFAKWLAPQDDKHRKRGEPTYAQRMVRHRCGTPACAGGHLGTWPPFIAWAKRTKDIPTWARFFGERDLSGEPCDLWEGDTDIFSRYGCNGATSSREAAAFIHGVANKFARQMRERARR